MVAAFGVNWQCDRCGTEYPQMSVVFTIGHGIRAIEEFIALLRAAGIERLVDVRAYPVSRRYPQFACAADIRRCANVRFGSKIDAFKIGGA